MNISKHLSESTWHLFSRDLQMRVHQLNFNAFVYNSSPPLNSSNTHTEPWPPCFIQRLLYLPIPHHHHQEQLLLLFSMLPICQEIRKFTIFHHFTTGKTVISTEELYANHLRVKSNSFLILATQQGLLRTSYWYEFFFFFWFPRLLWPCLILLSSGSFWILYSSVVRWLWRIAHFARLKCFNCFNDLDLRLFPLGFHKWVIFRPYDMIEDCLNFVFVTR